MQDDNIFSIQNQNPESNEPQNNNASPAAPTINKEQPVVEEGLMQVVKMTIDVVKRKFFLFLGGTILNFLIIGVLYIVFIPLIIVSTAKIGTIGIFIMIALLAIATLLLSFVFYGTMAHQAAATIKGETVKIGDSISKTFRNTGRAINLGFKIFLYSRIWLIFVVLLWFPIVNIFAFMGGGVVLVIVNFILGLCGLLCIVSASIRSLRAVFAFPTLMSEPDLSAKDCLQKSIAITKNKWWLVFSFITVFSFLLAIVPSLINFVALSTGVGFIKVISLIITVIFAILSYTTTISFFQVLQNKLSDQFKTLKLNIGVLISAILIFLLPIILSVVLPLLGFMALKSVFNQTASAPSGIISSSNVSAINKSTTALQSQQENPNAATNSPKIRRVSTGSGNSSSVDQKVFTDLQSYLFESEIWTQYYPMFAKDEKLATEYAAKLESHGFSSVEKEKPMFAPYDKILNYLGKGMYDYKKIDEKVGDTTAFYLYTAMAANLRDFKDTRRFEDLFCYPFVKEDGAWKMKIARFIPKGSYDKMALDDPALMKACTGFIKTQEPVGSDEVKKRLDLGYVSNLNFDIYLNNHLLHAYNIDSTRPLKSGASLDFFVKNGQNEITVDTGLFDKEKIGEAKATITLRIEKTIGGEKGIDIADLKLEDGYEIGAKVTYGDKVTVLTLTKKIGEITLGANEEKKINFVYNKNTDSMTSM